MTRPFPELVTPVEAFMLSCSGDERSSLDCFFNPDSVDIGAFEVQSVP